MQIAMAYAAGRGAEQHFTIVRSIDFNIFNR
jgi:hypothetical protein